MKSKNLTSMTKAVCAMAILVLGLGLTISPANADSITWTGASGGTWNTSNTNWNTVTTDPWNSTNGPGNIAKFDTADYPTVNVSDTVYANGLNLAQRPNLSGGTITLSGTTPSIHLGSGLASNSIAIISSALAGSAGVRFTATSGADRYITIQGNNSGLSGDVYIESNAWIRANSTTSTFGSGKVWVENGGTLNLLANRTVANNIDLVGNIDSLGGTTLSGNVTVAGDATIHNRATAAAGLTVSGIISGDANRILTFAFTATNDEPKILLTNANTFNGTVQFGGAKITAHGLQLNHANALQNATLGGDLRAQLKFGSGIDTFTVGGLSGTLGTITLSNTAAQAVTLRVGNNDGSTSSATVLSGIGNLEKIGSGTLTLSGTHGYTGTTTVSGGSLVVNGSLHADSAVTVAEGGTLGGSGTVGNIEVAGGGILSPGSSLGTLTVGDLTLADGAIINWEFLNAGVAGTDYDQIIGNTLYLPESGTVTINIVGLEGYSLALGNEFTLYSGTVDNFDANRFAFTGLDSSKWRVSEGSLVLTYIPEPSTVALVALPLLGLLLRRRRE